VVGGDAGIRGRTGQLLNITDAEAIVKLADGEMKVLDMVLVGHLYEGAP
jgi:hypothetical protein